MNNPAAIVGLTVATMFACLLAFRALRQFYWYVKRQRDFMRWAQYYAGYDQKQVAHERLWTTPAYYVRILDGIQKKRPEELLKKLDDYMPILEKVLAKVDFEFLRNSRAILRLFVKAYDDHNLIEQTIAQPRVELIKYIVGNGTHKLEYLNAPHDDLLNWLDGFNRWTLVTSHMTIIFKNELLKRS